VSAFIGMNLILHLHINSSATSKRMVEIFEHFELFILELMMMIV